MTDAECVDFLEWALPRLHLRWPGFRRVRRQVCRRIDRRRAALGLADIAAYRVLLEASPDEWAELDQLCRVTISRFARDRAVWADLVIDVLPRLARAASVAGRTSVRAWSAGCGAGEEPFTLAIAWELAVAPHWPGIVLDVIATDIDDVQLGRAAIGRFPEGTLHELPDDWRRAAFDHVQGDERLRERYRDRVRFARHDVRAVPPDGPFDLVLCRNLAFTYFDEPLQRRVAGAIRAVLRTGGVLVVGVHERVPEGAGGFVQSSRCLYTATGRESSARPVQSVGQPPTKERVMVIADLMSRNVATCKEDDRLEVAARMMWDLDIGCVAVVDDRQHVTGIITDRDICMATYTQGKSPQQIFVREAMAREVFSCLPDDNFAEAEEIMRKRRVRRLPVVDLDGHLVGLISLNDLARESVRQQTRVQKDLTPRDVSATLAAICQPRQPAILPPSA